MNQHFKSKIRYFPPLKTLLILVIAFYLLVVTFAAFKDKNQGSVDRANQPSFKNNFSIEKDSVASVKAFAKVYKVLMSPRCMNCHPAGDVPLQGDDSHLHTMSPKRGVDGKGLFAMKCSNCHQPTNTPGLHTPPGNPEWHLPPADMKMVFEGRTPHQLAKQLIDPAQNGNKTLEKLLEHANDTLVLAGWNPGEGRSLPPMSHAAFKKAWETWITKGAYAPKP